VARGAIQFAAFHLFFVIYHHHHRWVFSCLVYHPMRHEINHEPASVINRPDYSVTILERQGRAHRRHCRRTDGITSAVIRIRSSKTLRSCYRRARQVKKSKSDQIKKPELISGHTHTVHLTIRSDVQYQQPYETKGGDRKNLPLKRD
jgi:hypothetical protein